MSDSIKVGLGDRSYEIYLKPDFSTLGENIKNIFNGNKAVIVADSNVSSLYAGEVSERISSARIETFTVVFQAGEESKNLSVFEKILEDMHKTGLDRKGLVVALGGGVTGDMAGFAASAYMRGVPFVQVPTTLLSQVDSSVGGKTGVNASFGKNMIGAFYQPKLVYINTATLSTLPKEEFASGMAEVVKHGVIRDPEYFEMIENKLDDILTLDHEALREVIAGSCKVKSAVVSEDEREGGLRAILNFGHTVAHSLEKLTNYTGFRHGEAVSVGMVAAARLGEMLLGFPAESTERLRSLLQKIGLPTTYSNLSTDDIIKEMYSDKKTEGSTLRFVLPEKIGSVKIMPVNDIEAVRSAVESVYKI